MVRELAIDPTDNRAIESFPDILTFFGIELQSHASIILGLAVLVFGTIQAWGQLQSAHLLSQYHDYMFSTLVGTLGAGVMYQLLRLYVYGRLTTVLLYGTMSGFNQRKNEEISEFGEDKWNDLLPMRRANDYFSREVKATSHAVKSYRIINAKLKTNYWFISLAFIISFVLSYSALFGINDGYSLSQGSMKVLASVVLSCLFIGSVLIDAWHKLEYDKDVAGSRIAKAS